MNLRLKHKQPSLPGDCQARQLSLKSRPGEENPMNTGQLKLRRNNATTAFLLSVGIVLAYLCYQIAQPFLTAITWAAILAIVFAPMHERVRRTLKRPELSALVSTLLTVLVAILPVLFLTLAISREVAQGVQQVRANAANITDLETTITQMRYVGPAWQWVQEHFKLSTDTNEVLSTAAQRAGAIAYNLARGVVANVSLFIFNIVLVAFTLFFFFRDGEAIVGCLKRAVPLEDETAESVLQMIAEVVRASINGVVVISLIKGLLAGLAFWVLGVPSPALWGAVGAVASLIPVVGIALVWVPAALALWIQGAALKALILAVYGATLLSLIDNVLYPFLVKGQVRLHTLLVFFSALGGLAVFGFLGFVLGPVVTTLAVMLVEVASEYYAGRPVE
jgi:predicted PurR-regulated permease PerM